MTREFFSAAERVAAIGERIAPTDWVDITQARVDQFAEATGDDQWIHVDPERAKAGPFGGCIAHGYLTLSMAGSYFLSRLVKVHCQMGVNYGLDKVRFPAPVRVGRRIRASAEVLTVEPVKGGVQAVIRVAIEVEGQERPACIADTISRYIFE